MEVTAKLLWKIYLKSNPKYLIAGLVGSLVILLGFWFRIAEREQNSDFDRFDVVLWQNWITSIGAGYGELTPSTLPGQAVALTQGTFGVLIIWLIIIAFRMSFELTPR